MGLAVVSHLDVGQTGNRGRLQSPSTIYRTASLTQAGGVSQHTAQLWSIRRKAKLLASTTFGEVLGDQPLTFASISLR